MIEMPLDRLNLIVSVMERNFLTGLTRSDGTKTLLFGVE